LIERLAAQLLRRHVARRSDDGTVLRDRHVVEAARDAEVRDDGAIGGALDQDVVGLEVAMNDADVVRGVQALAELVRDRAEARPRHRRAELARERLAVDELHREEAIAAVLADVEHARDVLVVDPPRQADFAAKPLERVGGETGAEDFQRDALAELAVLGFVDATHATAAEPAHDAIAIRDQLGDVGRGAGGRRIGSGERVVITTDCHGRPS
jgi:hypothetical protein